MTSENHSDRVEQALNAFRDSRGPAGPPADLVDETLERLQSVNRSVRTLMTSSDSRKAWPARSRVLLAVGTLLVTIVSWVGLTSVPARIAFGDVKEQLEKAKTVRYVDTRLAEFTSEKLSALRDMSRNENEPGSEHRRFSLGDDLQARIITIRGPHLQRTDVLDADGTIKWIHIKDLKDGIYVTLDPKQKKLVEITSQVTIKRDSGETSEEAVKPMPHVDLIAGIREIPADATTRLPERTIAGKQVVGFYSRKTKTTAGGTDTWERTYWVDPETKLPVRIEVSHYSTDKRVGPSNWVLSGFVFGEDFPVSEFSTEPPPGYSTEAGNVIGIEVD